MKHTRPYTCSEPKCKIKGFGSNADLRRHLREIHHKDEKGSLIKLHLCPEVTCSRHRRGFARQWNMQEHYKRIHHGSLDMLAAPLGTPASSSSEPDESPSSPTPDDRSIASAPASTSSRSLALLSEARILNGGLCEGLRAALLAMKAKRQSMDDQISRFEKAIEDIESLEG